ncbi:hypothetical protein G7009_19965 [Pseudomonas capeferrum]|uniref:hypothetical protein n=1 Tax=Pseudomonas capeferrum TaxID=1495066 RepID=UPI0015E488DC|nr:hypothetical protein [Pseudomonas capeferrum]MBA1203999.1 hypothetical protein [Pseudomonas capeferrum]
MITCKCIARWIALMCASQLPAAWASQSLQIWIYPHDELVDISEHDLRNDYFQQWLDEMRSFTSHPIEIIFQRNVPGITDLAYAGKPSNEILDAFKDELRYRSSAPFSFMRKYVLLTRDVYDRSGLNYNAGLAEQGGTHAIASLDTFKAPAHEIGHLLNATHEHAATQFNGWFCETYMAPRNPLRSHCYRYSDENRANIADYLKYNSN